MQEVLEDDGNAADGNHVTVIDHRAPRKLKFQWCCLEPMFSGGGGIAFVGPGMSGPGANRDTNCASTERSRMGGSGVCAFDGKDFPVSAYINKDAPDYTSADGNNAMLRWFLRGSEDLHAQSCPRSLARNVTIQWAGKPHVKLARSHSVWSMISAV
jgi:hypothetical protein